MLKKYGMDVLTEKVQTGDRVIVIGDGFVGAETANYVAEYGTRKVTISETKPEIVADGEANPNHFLTENLTRHHVDVYVNVSITKITDHFVCCPLLLVRLKPWGAPLF